MWETVLVMLNSKQTRRTSDISYTCDEASELESETFRLVSVTLPAHETIFFSANMTGRYCTAIPTNSMTK